MYTATTRRAQTCDDADGRVLAIVALGRLAIQQRHARLAGATVNKRIDVMAARRAVEVCAGDSDRLVRQASLGELPRACVYIISRHTGGAGVRVDAWRTPAPPECEDRDPPVAQRPDLVRARGEPRQCAWATYPAMHTSAIQNHGRHRTATRWQTVTGVAAGGARGASVDRRDDRRQAGRRRPEHSGGGAGVPTRSLQR